jgi:hypothetical protein
MQYLLCILCAFFTSAAFSAEQAKPTDKREDLKKHMTITNNYVHSWLKFPPVKGRAILESGDAVYEPRPGRAMAVWTLSVSSIRTEGIIAEVQRLQKKYEALFTDFVYVFVNDLPKDIRGFANEWKLDGRIILGEDEFKEAFKYRRPPSVYLADRFGWLNWVSFEITESSLTEIDKYLEKMNVF